MTPGVVSTLPDDNTEAIPSDIKHALSDIRCNLFLESPAQSHSVMTASHHPQHQHATSTTVQHIAEQQQQQQQQENCGVECGRCISRFDLIERVCRECVEEGCEGELLGKLIDAMQTELNAVSVEEDSCLQSKFANINYGAHHRFKKLRASCPPWWSNYKALWTT
jgi:hypothetical protein